jgi:hypothetical protein
MNKSHLLFLWVLLLFSFSTGAYAQEQEVFKKKGYTLTFINQDKTFDPVLKKRMVNTFFKVYPVLSKAYNSQAVKEVTFVIDTAYKGVAATRAAKVSYNPAWFKQHPGDIDVVTHEVMHIVQNYGRGSGPGWITEGIADYARYKYGVDNDGAKWALTDYKTGQQYDNSYRITARFLAWMEKHNYKDIVKILDQNMRDHSYKEELWKTQTAMTLPELWAAYILNPVL